MDRQPENLVTNGSRAAAPAPVVPITVVIPVRNEAAGIESLLDALAGQTVAAQGVIVVDAGSTDGTRDILRRRAQVDPSLRIIEVPQAYPGVGRNLGTDAAETPWVAYVDGGTQPDPGMLAAFWQAVEADSGLDACYGFYRPLLTTRAARWFALAALPGARRLEAGLMRNHFTSCSMVRKTVWERVGGFPPYRAAEDRMFMARVDQGRVADVPEATLTWHSPQTWRQIWKRTVGMAEHSARAGRARDWHWPTLRLWGLGAVPFLLLPAGPAAGVMGLGILARAWRRLRRHRVEAPLCRRQWHDLPGVAAMLLVLDAATLLGWVKAIVIPASEHRNY